MSDHNDVPSASGRSANDDIVQKALSAAKQAEELKGAAIEKLLELRAQIERDLVTLGYHPAAPPATNGRAPKQASPEKWSAPKRSVEGKPFKDLTLARVGRILLSEHGTMHGSEIERLAKQGGFKSKADRFQSYLAVAFKRDGGFENTGGNNWILNDAGRAAE